MINSSWSDYAPGFFEISHDFFAWNAIAPRVRWSISTTEHRQKVYYVILKAPGLTDFELPVSSVNIRLRNTRASYINVMVPDPLFYTDDVLSRIQGGRLHVLAGEKIGNLVPQTEEIIYGNIQSLSITDGNRPVVSIVGTRYITHNNPSVVYLTGVSHISRTGLGRYVIQCAMDWFLKPTDTVIYDNIQFEVDMIGIVIKPDNVLMTVEGQ